MACDLEETPFLSVASVARLDFANCMAFISSDTVETSNEVALTSLAEPSSRSLTFTAFDDEELNKSFISLLPQSSTN